MLNISNSEHAALERLLSRSREIPPPKSELRCFVAGSRKQGSAQPGEIWTTRCDATAPQKEQSSLWVLVMKRLETARGCLFSVAPLFSDPTMADASDVILREGLLGFPAVVSLGLEMTATAEGLEARVTKLPARELRLLGAFSAWLGGKGDHCPQGLERGVPYLDDFDTRIAFHHNLSLELQHLQGPLQGWVSAGERTAMHGDEGNVIVVDFAAAIQADLKLLAADEGAPVFHQAFRVESLGVFVDVEAQALQGSSVAFNVFDGHGAPSLKMDGCVILDEAGRQLAVIIGPSCLIPVEKFRGAFSVLKGGVPLALVPEAR
jgi:hypothetical protein